MGLQDTPLSNRIHISFFGLRNAGKSSVMNAVTGQDLAVVSDVKAMELLPLGPVVVIDTPGIDDEGELGLLRVKKAYQVLNKTDIAVLVIDGQIGYSEQDKHMLELFRLKKIPHLVAWNKVDLLQEHKNSELSFNKESTIFVSATNGEGITELKERIAGLVQTKDSKLQIVGDILQPSDFVVLVVPIDKAAPKGRLILPQQQTIRDILEADATSIVVKEHELKQTLKDLGKKPRLVITDSQVFAKVNADTPSDIWLTSFSILMARYKGVLRTAVKSAKVLDSLQDGDKILISEGCTHHKQCDDIGSVKLPRWIKQYTEKQVEFDFTSGGSYPESLQDYKLIVHCGGCMLHDKEMKYRMNQAEDEMIPFTNYGILIAYIQGILRRSIAMFPDLVMELDD